jgi:AcrR family transcriptional regulator
MPPVETGVPRIERSCYFLTMSKGEQTRTVILDDALRLASQVGFEGLTIGQLAETTGLSKSGLFAHFRSKEQLQLQTLEHARGWFIDTVMKPALAAPRGEARLRALFEAWLRWEDLLDGGCIYVTAAVEYDDRPGPMRDALARHQRDWLDSIATIVRTAVAEGEFRGDVDPEQFAFELHALTLGFHQATRLLDDEQAVRRAHASFERLLTCSRP